MARFDGPSFVLILAFLLTASEAVRFELKSGDSKCISEDIKVNSLTVGKYHVVNPHEGQPLPDSYKITARVTSAHGTSHHYAEHQESGQFAFTAVEEGDYIVCFWAADHKPPVTIPLDFDWRTGVAAKDWGTVAKKDQVDAMVLELKQLNEAAVAIQEEMLYLRDREEEMQEMNRKTSSRMGWFSFLSLLVSLSVAGMQLWHLKNFFEKKKII